jgi:glycosyltransferase involved in cell wall biosynthesis
MPESRRIRILYVIGSLAIGGAEGQLVELLRHLDRSIFDPRLALFEKDVAGRGEGLVEEQMFLDIPSHKNGPWRPRGWHSTKGFGRLCRYLEKTRPHVVHAFLPGACIVACPAARVSLVPLVIASRRGLADSYRFISPLKNAAESVSMKFTDFMIGNSSAVTREIIEVDGFPPARTATIYNGVDTVRFAPRCGTAARARLGFSSEHFVLGIVANFHAYKRHIDVVHAAAQLRTRYPQCRFVLVGEDRNGVLNQVREEIQRLNLQSDCVLIPGTPAPEDLFAAMDVYVCTSQTEGFSNVLLEAMASGKPVVATDVGGNRDAVVEGETGFLVPAQAPARVAEAAERLLLDPSLRARMGSRGRARVLERFSLAAMTTAHQQLYQQLLRDRTHWRLNGQRPEVVSASISA